MAAKKLKKTNGSAPKPKGSSKTSGTSSVKKSPVPASAAKAKKGKAAPPTKGTAVKKSARPTSVDAKKPAPKAQAAPKPSSPAKAQAASKAAPKKAPAPEATGKAAPTKAAPTKAAPTKAAPTKAEAPKASKPAPKPRAERAPVAKLVTPREPPRVLALPLPMLPTPRRPSVEERSESIERRLAAQSEEFRHRYIESLDMSWIYHDSALEGVVYTFEELRTALSKEPAPVTDSSLQPTYDDIRRHKEAIEFTRDFATKKRLPITVDIIKKLYLILHPEEGDIKTVKYRKDIPQHRLYFHEYTAPDKIAYKVRQVVDWLGDPETRKTRNGIRIAARAHYDLLRIYPFPVDSGKVSRLFMNMLLLRSGLPPSIIHSTERQRYYEALKGSATTVLQMVQESVENALSSVEKLLDEHESKKRAFVS